MQPNKAIVGRNAFAHEAGIHQDGMIKNALTYEIMTPQSVGVPGTSFVLGKHSGRHALRQRCEEHGFHLNRRELDYVYRQFLALGDEAKSVDDRMVLEIIGAMRRRELSNDLSGESRLPIPPGALACAFGATGADAILPHENEQQEDYLWGV